MKHFAEDDGAPPSTLRAPASGDVDDRPTDVDPIRAPSFHSFGELTDAELREIVASQQTPLPISRWAPPPPSERRTFIVYERMVDTRLLRRGASPMRSGLSDFVAVAAFVGLFTGVMGIAAAMLAPEPPAPTRTAESARSARPLR